MNRNLFVSSLILGTGLMFLGCGDDGNGLGSAPESTTSLSTAEQKAVSEAVANSLSTVGGLAGINAKIGKIMITRAHGESSEVNDEIACLPTGKILVVGTVEGGVSDDGKSADGHWDLTTTYQDCEVEQEDSSGTLKLDGDLKTKGDYEVSNSGTQEAPELSIEFGGSTVGGVEVTGAEAGNGVCGVDLTTKITFNSQGGSSSITGELCGVEYNESSDFSPETKVATK